MAEDISPTVARRQLRLVLREARERAQLTQQDVAEQMEWSHSKVIRIESGDNTIAPNDLRALLTYLGVTDRDRITELLGLTKIARTRQRAAWYQAPEYREFLTPALLRLIEYEAEAVAMRYYSVFYLPGPLQTLEYALANFRTLDEDEVSEEQQQHRADARVRRREAMVARRGQLTVYALFDESVFRRPVGGPEVFAEQLQHLIDYAATGQLRIRMIPFDFTAMVTNNASFELASLDEGDEGSEVLYRETGISDELVEDIRTVQRHHRRFDKIWQEADSEEDTIDFMRTRIAELRAPIRRRGSLK